MKGVYLLTEGLSTGLFTEGVPHGRKDKGLHGLLWHCLSRVHSHFLPGEG